MTAPSLRLLLSTLIDYAALFSPAKVALTEVVTDYERYSASPQRWMLGRLVIPLAQLSQFENCLDQLDRQYAPAFWPLSIVLEPSLEALEALAPWLKKQHRFTVSALEFTRGDVGAIASLLPHLPPHSDRFFEVGLDATLPNYLAALQGTQAAVKVRTGGLTSADFPDVATLAQFIVACARARVPFKSTAGLHHPLRSWQRLPDGSFTKMHGFLNVALASAFAYGSGATVDEVATILQIDTPNALIFSAQEIICHGPLRSQPSKLTTLAGRLPLEILANVRSRYFLGISTCSFQEPLAGLNRLGLVSNTSTAPSHTIELAYS